MDRNDLLCYNTRNKSERIPFITWHQQLQDIPKVIHSAYKAVIKKYPAFQNTFKEPRIVAYRRPKNLMSHLVKRRYTNNITAENIPKMNQKHSPAIVLTNQKPSLTLCRKYQQKFKVVTLLIEV